MHTSSDKRDLPDINPTSAQDDDVHRCADMIQDRYGDGSKLFVAAKLRQAEQQGHSVLAGLWQRIAAIIDREYRRKPQH